MGYPGEARARPWPPPRTSSPPRQARSSRAASPPCRGSWSPSPLSGLRPRPAPGRRRGRRPPRAGQARASPRRSRLRRADRPLPDQGHGRGPGACGDPQGHRPGGRRPGQRRRRGGHPSRGDGGQRPAVEHRLRGRAHRRPAPGPGPERPTGACLDGRRALGPVAVPGRGAAGQDARHRRLRAVVGPWWPSGPLASGCGCWPSTRTCPASGPASWGVELMPNLAALLVQSDILTSTCRGPARPRA